MDIGLTAAGCPFCITFASSPPVLDSSIGRGATKQATRYQLSCATAPTLCAADAAEKPQLTRRLSAATYPSDDDDTCHSFPEIHSTHPALPEASSNNQVQFEPRVQGGNKQRSIKQLRLRLQGLPRPSTPLVCSPVTEEEEKLPIYQSKNEGESELGQRTSRTSTDSNNQHKETRRIRVRDDDAVFHLGSRDYIGRAATVPQDAARAYQKLQRTNTTLANSLREAMVAFDVAHRETDRVLATIRQATEQQIQMRAMVQKIADELHSPHITKAETSPTSIQDAITEALSSFLPEKPMGDEVLSAGGESEGDEKSFPEPKAIRFGSRTWRDNTWPLSTSMKKKKETARVDEWDLSYKVVESVELSEKVLKVQERREALNLWHERTGNERLEVEPIKLPEKATPDQERRNAFILEREFADDDEWEDDSVPETLRYAQMTEKEQVDQMELFGSREQVDQIELFGSPNCGHRKSKLWERKRTGKGVPERPWDVIGVRRWRGDDALVRHSSMPSADAAYAIDENEPSTLQLSNAVVELDDALHSKRHTSRRSQRRRTTRGEHGKKNRLRWRPPARRVKSYW